MGSRMTRTLFCIVLFFLSSRHEFDSEQVPDLTRDVFRQDIHSVGSLCKLYFRELPNPLLTYQLYDRFSVRSRAVELGQGFMLGIKRGMETGSYALLSTVRRKSCRRQMSCSSEEGKKILLPKCSTWGSLFYWWILCPRMILAVFGLYFVIVSSVKSVSSVNVM